MSEWQEIAKGYIVDRLSLRVHACPFCGSVRTALVKMGSYHVLCFNCGAGTFFCENEHHPDRVIDMYNTRAQKAKTVMASVYGKAALEAGKEDNDESCIGDPKGI